MIRQNSLQLNKINWLVFLGSTINYICAGFKITIETYKNGIT